jgi:hypothetical protein
VKDKTARQLADAIATALEAHRLTVEEFMAAFWEHPYPAKYKRLIPPAQRASLFAALKPANEPTAAELKKQLEMFDALKRSPEKMRALLKQRIKELPHPRGGAPRKVAPRDERMVCAEIEALRPEYDTRGAIQQVASKRGVSERTIYRVWGKYHPKKKRVRKATT